MAQFEDDNIQINAPGEIIFPSHIAPKNQNFKPSTPIHNKSPNNNSYTGRDSPFFRPSTPQQVTVTRTVSTPNGTRVLQQKKRNLLLRSKTSHKTDIPESKSSIIGATCNLINCIIGAGIIAIPYAFNQTGILAGLFLMIVVAILTDKSLQLLIATGKRAGVQSYETLMEAIFGGRSGLVFILINMFLMSYGAMVCYLLIIRQTFGNLIMGNHFMMDSLRYLGFTEGLNEAIIGRWFLVFSSLLIILPLSMQRDMANLSFTSIISVVFDIVMVLIVALCSPVKESIEESGGITNVIQQSTIHISTLFIGLGVLSFAFVCQDSSFIIAGSLHRPTKKRWGTVTGSALFLSAALGCIIGIAGYLGFQDKTMGNILQNFVDVPTSEVWFGSIHTYQAINLARTLLGLTMYCVYPLSSYITRHVLIVLFFSGKTAHSGDDHSVLARWDRRFSLTFTLYISALVPALLCDNLGTILSLTGAVAGSCLSYLGPGIAYLGVFGHTFLSLVQQKWKVNNGVKTYLWKYPLEKTSILEDNVNHDGNDQSEPGYIISSLRMIAWYSLLMPLWCIIASKGGDNFKEFEKNQAMKSPAIRKRIGDSLRDIQKKQNYAYSPLPSNEVEDGLSNRPRPNLIAPSQQTYGSINGSSLQDKVVGNSSATQLKRTEVRDDAQPTTGDFVLAASYIIFGIVALVAGIFSITSQ